MTQNLSIQKIYDYAKLATLAYVDLSDRSTPRAPSTIIDVANDDQNPGRTARLPKTLGTQMLAPGDNIAADISGTWTVLDPYFKTSTATGHSDPASGFAAMLVQNNTSGEKVLAIAGTEPNGPGQLAADLTEADLHQIGGWGMALGQVVSLYNYVQVLRATGKVDQLVLRIGSPPPPGVQAVQISAANIEANTADAFIWLERGEQADGLGMIGANETLTVTGHSLGGHVAALATALFPDLFTAAVTFNAPGYNPLTSRDTFPLGGADRLLGLFTQFGCNPLQVANITDKVLSYVSEDTIPGDDTSGVAGSATGTPFGQVQNVINEKNTHDMGSTLDSLAVQALFAQLDPSLTMETTGKLIEAASSEPNKSYEVLLRALYKFITGSALQGLPDTGPSGLDSIIDSGEFSARSIYYDYLIDLTNKTKFRAMAGKTTVALLTELNATAIAAKAKEDNAQGLAYRYALQELNCFAVVGADYSQHNSHGELDLFDPTSQEGNLSEQWLTDRSEMLAEVNQARQQDNCNGNTLLGTNTSGTTDTICYEDKTSGLTLQLAGIDPEVVNRRFIRFGSTDNETLTGGSRADHLFGGDGIDTLNGGNGADYLEGGKGNDLYIWNIGDGNDQIVETREEKDGKIHGLITIRDNDGEYVAAGQFERKKDGSGGYLNEWEKEINDVDTVSLIHGATWKLRMPDGSLLDLGNDFQDGDFGINLVEPPDDAPAVPNINGVTVHGDLKPKVFKDDDGDHHYEYDDLGNIVVTDISESGREDELYGSGDNDHLLGFAGDDYLSGKSGNDLLEGGAGNDSVRGGDGTDVLVGGTENDCLFGGADSDVLFAEEQEDTARLIELGESGAGTGSRGDLLSGQEGEDWIYGRSGNDVLSGGGGRDFLYGGAGDDTIEGDSEITWAHDDWNVTRSTETQNNLTRYIRTYSETDSEQIALEEQGGDFIYGGAGNDWIFAQGGDDFIDAGADDDVVFGEGGADILLGKNGNDTLIGDTFNTPVNEQGKDYLDGGAGNDELYGGGQDDILLGGAGNDTLFGDYSNASVEEQGADSLDGGDGDDTLFGGGNDDFLFGGAGNDELNGGDGNDTLYGGADNDLLLGQDGDDTLYGDAGNDELQGGEGNDTLYGGAGNDLLLGQDGDDTLYGDAGDDQLQGGEGNDTLYGGDGKDLLAGQDGDDTLYGDAGDDQLQGGAAKDTLYGGNDNDLLLGQDGDDILYGDAGNDELQGGEGNDTLYGGSDNDLLFGQNGDDILYGDAGDDHIQGDGGKDTLYGGEGIDELQGGEGDDNLFGGDGKDLLAGQDGDDSLYGDAGNDELQGGEGNDAIHGGSDNDTLFGQNGDDTLYGDAGDDHIQGDGGKDTLYGGAGVDELQGGEGNDAIHGGSDNDLLFGQNGDDILYGDAGDDELQGGEGNDTLHGGKGKDFLEGGAGNDVYVISSGDGVDCIDDIDGPSRLVLTNISALASLEWMHASVSTSGGISYSQNGSDIVIRYGATNTIVLRHGEAMDFCVQLADGSTYNRDEFFDNAFEYRQYSSLSDDIDCGNTGGRVYGGGGDDTIRGGSGQDFLCGDSGWSEKFLEILFKRALWFDKHGNPVYPSGIAIGGQSAIEQDNDVLWGGDGNDILDGGRGDDALYGGGGDDELYGGVGNDRLEGDARWGNPADPLTNFGQDHLYGGEGNDLLNGGTGDDILSGDGGDDDLQGGDGNDSLTGGAGADRLDGGDGRDRADYSSSDTSLVINLATGLCLGGEATGDQLISIEGIYGSKLNDTLTGDDTNNAIDGMGGSDLIHGGNGDDDLSGFGSIYGDDGNDRIGGDYLYVDQQGSHIYDTSYYYGGAGNDGITARGILDGGEGDDSLSGTINTSNDYLNGGAGNDYLCGEAGLDTLIGGEGNDILCGDCVPEAASCGDTDWLEGGAGDDTYAFTIGEYRSSGIDFIIDTDGHSTVQVTTTAYSSPITSLRDIKIGLSNIYGNFYKSIMPNDGSDTCSNSVSQFKNELYSIVNFNQEYVTSTERADLIISFRDNHNKINDAIIILGGGNSSLNFTYDFGNGFTCTHADIISFYANTPHWFRGSQLDDSISGFENNDTISGFAGDDVLRGNNGNDSLTGGIGNDTLVGGSGNDLYVFNFGDGQDSIEDFDVVGSDDCLRFDEGITADAIMVVKSGDDLVFRLKDTTDQVTIRDYFVPETTEATGSYNHKINKVEFGSFESWDQEAIQNLANQAAGNHAPVLNRTISPLEAQIDHQFTYTIAPDTMIDPDAWDTIAYSITMADGSDLPSWLSFDRATLTLAGTPEANGPRTLQLELWASDNFGGRTGQCFTLTTTNTTPGTNDPPEPEEPITVTEGSSGTYCSFNYSIDASTFSTPESGDTCLLNRGDGQHIITENDATDCNTDTAIFGSDIASDQLWFRHVGNNLEVSVIGTNDALTCQNWYSGSPYHVEQFKTMDNKVLLDSQVEALVSAMAAFAPPAAGQTALPQNCRAALAPVIAANWH